MHDRKIETGRRLDDRIRDNFYDKLKNDFFKPVSNRFNSSIYFISDFVTFGLSFVNGGSDCRKTKEMRVFNVLGTQNPHGIDEHFTFGVELTFGRSWSFLSF